MKMANKSGLETQVKSLESAMGAIVKAFKEMKSHFKALEEKVEEAQNHEVREIIKSQKMLEELISANSNDIKSIDQEIKKLKTEKLEADLKRRGQKRKTSKRNVNILTEDIANLKWTVNSHIQVKFVKST